MKITSDNEDSHVFDWNEDLSHEDDYFYELYVLIEGKEANIIITSYGVSIEFPNKYITTNITPRKLFPNKDRLDWNDLSKIVWILEDTDLEGKSYSSQEMNDFLQYYKDNVEDQ